MCNTVGTQSFKKTNERYGLLFLWLSVRCGVVASSLSIVHALAPPSAGAGLATSLPIFGRAAFPVGPGLASPGLQTPQFQRSKVGPMDSLCSRVKVELGDSGHCRIERAPEAQITGLPATPPLRAPWAPVVNWPVSHLALSPRSCGTLGNSPSLSLAFVVSRRARAYPTQGRKETGHRKPQD